MKLSAALLIPASRPVAMGALWAVLALLATAALSACSGQHESDRPKVFLLSEEWKETPISEADLTLPEEAPLAVSSLHRLSGTKFVVEDFYLFDGSEGVEGYIVTIRNPGDSLPESTMLEMRQIRLFYAYVSSLPETLQYELQIGPKYGRFTNGHPHSVGHYTIAPSKTGPKACFFARVGMLLVEERSAELPPGAIDTQIFAVLCGEQIDEEEWVATLQKSKLADRLTQALRLRKPS